jgi:peroxiredoxin Q/BCP
VYKYLILTALAGLILCSGCMMPDREKQVQKNEERMAAEGMTALARGDSAPAFTTARHDGAEFSIPGDLAGNRVVLFFYPADNTPNTTRDLQALEKFVPELSEAGISVYAVSGGTLAEHQSYADRYHITVPLLVDSDLAIAQSYGCAPEDAEFVQRTLVGINTDGTIAFFERGFPLMGKVQPILDWFAGSRTAAEADAAVESEVTTAEGGKLADLDEETRQAIYLEIKLAREQAWEEAEMQFPLDAPDVDQREQVRAQSELALQLEDEYLNSLSETHELLRQELADIEAEGDQAEWPGSEA